MVCMILKILFRLVILMDTLVKKIQSQICIYNYKIYQITGQ